MTTPTPTTTAKLQDGVASCWGGFKDAAVSTGSWIGRTFQKGFEFISDIARKVMNWFKPYFEKLTQYAQNNPATMMFTAIGVVVGGALTALLIKCCCGEETPAEPTPAPIV